MGGVQRSRIVILLAMAAACALAGGTAEAAPDALIVSPASVRFGQTPGIRWITFTNGGLSPVVLGPVAISWRGRAAFALQGDTCGGEVVALRPGSSCRLGVVFKPPKKAGHFQARFKYAVNERLAAVALSGGAG
jgi:hypothetical protein